MNIPALGQVGTLDPIPKKEVKNVLTGFVRETDRESEAFANHQATTYVMEKIPTINLMDIEYFLPMVAGAIDGYYKVEKVYIGSSKGSPCLKLKLSTYIPLGEMQVLIYRLKMQPGELISESYMKKLYE